MSETSTGNSSKIEEPDPPEEVFDPTLPEGINTVLSHDPELFRPFFFIPSYAEHRPEYVQEVLGAMRAESMAMMALDVPQARLPPAIRRRFEKDPGLRKLIPQAEGGRKRQIVMEALKVLRKEGRPGFNYPGVPKVDPPLEPIDVSKSEVQGAGTSGTSTLSGQAGSRAQGINRTDQDTTTSLLSRLTLGSSEQSRTLASNSRSFDENVDQKGMESNSGQVRNQQPLHSPTMSISPSPSETDLTSGSGKRSTSRVGKKRLLKFLRGE